MNEILKILIGVLGLIAILLFIILFILYFVYASREKPVTKYSVLMNGESETPKNDVKTLGYGTFILNNDNLFYDIEVISPTSNIIHAGVYIDEYNDLIIPLVFTQVNNTDNWKSAGVHTIDEFIKNKLVSNNLYVNVMTDKYPSGEIKGYIKLNKSCSCP